MKRLSSLLGILCMYLSVYGQTLNDVAVSQGVTSIQQSHFHWGIGMSFFDFDKDGWDDLTMPFQTDSVIFYKNMNGNFQQVPAFIDPIGPIREIIWVDYDNDEDYDLCVTYAEIGIRLYNNDGTFNFSEVNSIAGIAVEPMNCYGVAFADFNKDSHLDMYVCNYSGGNGSFAQENLLYMNMGNGTFTNITASAGVGNGVQPTFMAMWYDFDEDNDLDLHVINDKNPYEDALYRNNGDSTFTNVATAMGVSNPGHDPMGIDVGDFDNSGYQDVVLSDVGGGNATFSNATDTKLFHNQDGLGFLNISTPANVDTSIMGWGVVWFDYDNDGFQDLYLASSKLDSVVANEETSLFFHNDTQGAFELYNDSIVGDIVCSSYAPVKGDINNDGFYDLAVLNDGVPSNLFMNSASENSYIKITPVGTASNKMAIGTKVYVYTQGIQQYQIVTCGSGICSQSSQHLIFGTGSSATVDSVILEFPSGIVVKKFQLPTWASYQIEEKVQANVDIFPGTNFVTLCQGDSLLLNVHDTTLNDIVWNTGSMDTSIYVSTAGSYFYEAESVNGDTVYMSNPLNVFIETTPIYQTIVNDPDCGLTNAGEATLWFVSPPANNFTIQWSNGDVGVTMDSVAGGTYDYSITSMNGCLYTGSVTITETPTFSVQFLTSPETDDSLGAVQFFLFGGVAPFSYEMNGMSESEIISGLSAGSYEVTITDANGCEVTVPFVVDDHTTAGIAANTRLRYLLYSDDGKVVLSLGPIHHLETLEVYSLTGELIANQSDFTSTSIGSWEMNRSIGSGIYFISIKAGGQHAVERLFVR